MSLYQELQDAGCETSSHESDLYVKATPEATTILARHPCNVRRFASWIDGSLWWDVPFMYEPWWQARESVR